MVFPLSISDIGLWFAFTAIILLITSELIFFSHGCFRNIAVNRGRFRVVALAMGVGFMVTVALQVYRPF